MLWRCPRETLSHPDSPRPLGQDARPPPTSFPSPGMPPLSPTPGLPTAMRALSIPGDGEKTVTHSDAASGRVDTERLFTLLGDEEEVVKRGVGEAAKCPLKED